MGVDCKISLFAPQTGMFKPGELVSGVVRYSVSKNMNFTGIALTFQGMAFCKWKKEQDMVYVRIKTTYRGGQEIFSITKNLLEMHLDACTPRQAVAVAAGSYQQGFEFLLPLDIPYSVDASPMWEAYVAYSLKVNFESTGIFTDDSQFESPVKVAPYVDLIAAPHATFMRPQSLVLTRPWSPLCGSTEGGATVFIRLPKAAFMPGEKIHLQYYVENNTTLTLRCKAKMYKIKTMQAKNDSKRKIEGIFRDYAKMSTIGPGGAFTVTSDLDVPFYLQPSLLNCSVLRIEYILRVRLYFPRFRRGVSTDIPVVIGTNYAGIQSAGEEYELNIREQLRKQVESFG